jgi:indolepyruvate ferredoxin oxidoreductase beta subunit
MSGKAVNVLMAGVGGQGTLAASEVLAHAALREGLEAKQSEVHGVAQRGGSVVSHVRFGARVHSPLIPCGSADVLCSGEQLEALRFAHYVEPGGTIVTSDQRLEPVRMPGDASVYPERIPEFLRAKGYDVLVVPALRMAMDLGDRRCANAVLLGALAAFLPIGREAWRGAIERRLPAKALELNLRAFEAGGACAASGREETVRR